MAPTSTSTVQKQDSTLGMTTMRQVSKILQDESDLLRWTTGQFDSSRWLIQSIPILMSVRFRGLIIARGKMGGNA